VDKGEVAFKMEDLRVNNKAREEDLISITTFLELASILFVVRFLVGSQCSKLSNLVVSQDKALCHLVPHYKVRHNQSTPLWAFKIKDLMVETLQIIKQ
jgi:hypothetical protein